MAVFDWLFRPKHFKVYGGFYKSLYGLWRWLGSNSRPGREVVSPATTLTEHELGVLSECLVEEAVDERVDGVVDEEWLDTQFVGELPHGAEVLLKVTDHAPEHHDRQVRQEAEDVGQGHGEQHRGGLPHT